MRTLEEYKEYVKATDPLATKEIEEAERTAHIITTVIKQRKALGLSQRDLAELCNISPSSVARFESCNTSPNLNTLLNILRHLGLSLTISPAKMSV